MNGNTERSLLTRPSVPLTSILYRLSMTKKMPYLSPECLPSLSFGSLSHTTHPGFSAISESQLLAGHLCLDVLANTKLLCSLSVNYFSPKHTFPISQVTNYSSSKDLACNQFPQGINFHSSLSFTLPLSTDYFNSNVSKTHPLFQLSQSKPWALHSHNSLICLLTLLLKTLPHTFSLHYSLAQKTLSPQYTRGKLQSPSRLSGPFTISTIVPLHLYLLLFRKQSLVWPRPSPRLSAMPCPLAPRGPSQRSHPPGI